MLAAGDDWADEGGISHSGDCLDGAAPAPDLRWQQDFHGDERELRVMRRWLASLLPGCPACDDVTSVATELAANAIRHTASGKGGKFRVEISRLSTAVRVVVADGGAPHGPRLIDDPAGEHGRGLVIVARLSVNCGALGGKRGRLVWADVPWNGAVPVQELKREELAPADDSAVTLPASLAAEWVADGWDAAAGANR